MGLDQYLYRLKGDVTQQEYEECLEGINKEYRLWSSKAEQIICLYNKSLDLKRIGQWRKHYKLNNYMQQVFNEKREGDFNCKYLELEYNHIMDIINLYKKDEYTVEVMNKALQYMNKGYKIWYYNWY